MMRLGRWRRLRVLVKAVLLAVSVGASAAPSPGQPGTGAPQANELFVLADELKHASTAVRARFAKVALDEMIWDFRNEARRAREERGGHGDADLLRWSRAVDALVADLQRLADSIDDETSVIVSPRPGDALYLVVADAPVLISSPRGGADTALENRILQRFCQRSGCRTQVAAARREADLASIEAGTVWRFGDAAGPVCASGDGLEFQFRDHRELPARRAACSRIVAELSVLAEALRSERRRGTRLDWSRLHIGDPTRAGQQRVILNEAGAFVVVPVPTLQARPELIGLVLPWLDAKVEGKRYNLVVLHAERFLRASTDQPGKSELVSRFDLP